MKENMEITPEDSGLIESLAMKISNREEFENHLRFFDNMLAVCKEGKLANPMCFLFLMFILEEVSEYCKKTNDRQTLLKIFLEVQFLRFPQAMEEYRPYKMLMIKYFPFYMLKNLSFLNLKDPVKEIIEKHKEFKTIFHDATKPIKIDGMDIGLINPVDLIATKKLKTLLTTESPASDHVLDMLRLEIEIWENFIYQISSFDKAEKKNYQCMNRSIIFHHFLKLLSKLKKKNQKIAIGNFLQNLCIHNDDLVKLILQQGFEDYLIPDAVEYIEWFHVCLIYCDSLLTNTFESKKLHFYYKLLTESIKKYPAQISKEVARNLIVNHFAYVELNPEENQVVLESIKVILETFPTLMQEKVLLIQHYKKIQKELCTFDISYIYIDRLTKDLEKLVTPPVR
jgi:hypothetical protein